MFYLIYNFYLGRLYTVPQACDRHNPIDESLITVGGLVGPNCMEF